MSQPPPILNLDQVHLTDQQHGDNFAARLGAISQVLGAQKLGYRLVVIPPGKKAWPYHCHHANEEMFLILEGQGTLRFADEEYPLRAGDVIAAPPGQTTPHQILNTSQAELRYLAVSTMAEPDVIEYPDSQKVVVFAGAAPGGDKTQRSLTLINRTASNLDYWEGES